MGITEELVHHILQTDASAFDSELIDRACDRVFDVLGCVLSGSSAPGCDMVLDLIEGWGGKKESRILVHGGKVPAHNAAMVNSIMARSFDFEPAGPYVNGKSIPAHLSGTTVPAALAVAEKVGAGGREFLTALILGDDLASRVVAASAASLDSGWDCTGTANVLGATAIAGKLMGLDKDQLLNAFGLAVNQCAGTFQNIFDGAHSFKLPQGLAARAGIVSAELAQKGFTGLREPLLSRYGYFALYSGQVHPEILTQDLGKEFFADYTLKPYPCCRSNHAAIDCVLELMNKPEINIDHIEEIIVCISKKGYEFAVGQPFKIEPVPQINASFNLQYNVSSAILRKDVKLDYFTDEYIKDKKIFEIIKKVQLKPDMPNDKVLAAEVSMKMKDGNIFSHRVDIPKGNGAVSPLSYDEKIDKYMSNVEFSHGVSKENAIKGLEKIQRMMDVGNMNEIIGLYVR